MPIYIDKIKVNYATGTVTVNYTESNEQGITNSMTLKSNELAGPELYDALKHFGGYVEEIFRCKFDSNVDVRVHTIIFKRNTCYALSKIMFGFDWDCSLGTTTVNTPEMPFSLFYEKTLNAEQAALNYLEDNRAQMGLFDDEEQGKEADSEKEHETKGTAHARIVPLHKKASR